MIIRSVFVIIAALLFPAIGFAAAADMKIHAKDTLYAGSLFRKAMDFDREAVYDSAVFYYQSAGREYLKKRSFKKYLECSNRIISAKINAGYNEGLIREAKENIAFSIDKLGEKSSATGECYFKLGNIYLEERKLDSALIWFKKSLDIYRNPNNADNIAVADIYRGIGIIQSNRGLFDSARKNIDRSIDIRKNYFMADDGNFATDYNALGSIAYHLGRYDSCEYYFGRVARIRENTSGKFHPLTAEAYNNLGVLFMEKAMWDTAMVLHRKAYEIRLARLPPNHKDIALSLNNLANVYMALGDNETALSHHRKALDIRLALHGSEDHTDIAMSYTNIGVLLRETGRYREGLDYFRAALEILLRTLGEDSPYTASAYNNVGAGYDDLGDYNNCLKYLKKALSLRLARGPDAPGIPGSYNNIGTIYKKKGDIDLALAYYRISREKNRKAFGEMHPDMASNYRKMGDIFLLKDQNDTALYYYNRALHIDTCIIEKNNPAVVEDFLNRGMAYGQLNDRVRELNDYKSGLAMSETIYGESHPMTAGFYTKIAHNMLSGPYPDSALFFMRRALEIKKTIYPSRHPGLSSAFKEMGIILERTGHPDSAMIMFNKSLVANYQGEADNNGIERSLVIDGPLFASSLIDMSRLKYDEYLKTGNISALRDITINFDLVKSLTQSAVSDFLLEETKIGLLNELSAQTYYGVDAAYRLFMISGNREHLFKALEFSELNKASLLQSLVFRYRDKRNADIPDSLLYKRRNLTGYIDYLRMQVKQKKTGSGIHPYRIDSLLISLRAVNDTINHYSVTEKMMSFPSGRELYDTLIRNLGPRTALISYYTNDTSLFTFVISDDTLVLNKTRLDRPGALKQKVEDYISALRKYDRDRVTLLGHEIYNLAFRDIEPVLKDEEKLVIIPDKILLYLPFETLARTYKPAGKFSDFSHQDYLVNDFGITYHYSAGLWAAGIPPVKAENNRLLAFAPVFNYRSTGNDGNKPAAINESDYKGKTISSNRDPIKSYAELPFSLEETDSLKALSLRYGLGADIFTGQIASEKNLKENIANHRFVHIATHLVNDDPLPEYSGLLFSDYSEGGTSEDNLPDRDVEGILHALEIYPMSIDADLVAMSACESGMGKLEEGEGIIGLVRAFLSAGAKNVLFSYWKVGDKNAMMFMRDFYSHVFTGYDFETALRKVKLDMIGNPDTSFPLMWGAFAVIGRQPEDR